MTFDRLPPLAQLRPEPEIIEPECPMPTAGSSLEFLRAVYSDPNQPLHRRMRAAVAALPFEHPKFAVVGRIVPGEGFAARLEEAIARSRKVIEAKPQNIEQNTICGR
jgi:hypothetical protein